MSQYEHLDDINIPLLQGGVLQNDLKYEFY